MPVLKPIPYTEFDPKNPEHVMEIMAVIKGGVRNMNLKFNFPPPYTNGIDYAKHLMALAWGEHTYWNNPSVGVRYEIPNPTIDAASSGSDNIRQLPVIGRQSKPLQDKASRGLPPGSTLS